MICCTRVTIHSDPCKQFVHSTLTFAQLPTPPARSPARFYGACRGAGKVRLQQACNNRPCCSRKNEKARKTNVLRASNRGARGRLEAFAMVPLSAGVRVYGSLEMPLNLPLKRELPSRRAHYGSEAQLPGDMLDRLPGPQVAASCILQLFLGAGLKLSSQRRSLAGDQRCQVWRNTLRLPAAVVVIQVVAIDRAHSHYSPVLTRLIVPAERICGAGSAGILNFIFRGCENLAPPVVRASNGREVLPRPPHFCSQGAPTRSLKRLRPGRQSMQLVRWQLAIAPLCLYE